MLLLLQTKAMRSERQMCSKYFIQVAAGINYFARAAPLSSFVGPMQSSLFVASNTAALRTQRFSSWFVGVDCCLSHDRGFAAAWCSMREWGATCASELDASRRCSGMRSGDCNFRWITAALCFLSSSSSSSKWCLLCHRDGAVISISCWFYTFYAFYCSCI